MSAKISSIYGVDTLFIIRVYFKIHVGYTGQALGIKGGGCENNIRSVHDTHPA